MSTKIYNAGIIKKPNSETNYTFRELCDIIDEIKKDIRMQMYKDYAKIFLYTFVRYVDFIDVFGVDALDKVIEEAQENKTYTGIERNSFIQFIELLKVGNFNYAKYDCDDFLQKMVDKVSNNDTFSYSPFYMKSAIYVCPTKTNKLLFAYFGNTTYSKFIWNREDIEDYHYQNQCDKPDDISDEEWNIRKNDWNEAIGPDYIFSNHGFIFSFNDPNLSMIFSPPFKDLDNIDESLFPSETSRIEALIQYCDDKPKPHENANSLEIYKYEKTDEYKKWKEEKSKYISSILRKLDSKEIGKLLKQSSFDN